MPQPEGEDDRELPARVKQKRGRKLPIDWHTLGDIPYEGTHPSANQWGVTSVEFKPLLNLPESRQLFGYPRKWLGAQATPGNPQSSGSLWGAGRG